VKVIDDPKVVNAFCMPGGKMAIYTGLIQKLDSSDDEIAQVMAHEIAHALAGHGAEKMSVDLLSSIAVAAVTAVAAGRTQVDGQTLQSTANLASNVFVTLPNSREEEAEADKMGIEIAARAGYDPRAAVTLWQKMIKESGGASRLDFLSTHPASPKRIEALAALEAPMMEIYGKAKAHQRAVRAWTSTPPNERVVGDPADAPPEGRGGNEQPLVFYSPVFEAFKNGSLELTCKSECAASFMLKQGKLRELFDKKDWRLLALETIQVGYRFDLSYYYLGESAAGLGFADAAGKYFGEAAKLASTDDACAKGVFIQCKGIDVTEGARQALNGRGR
jgi:type IV pilus biogenesis protein CpaD/CtpE